MFDLNGGRSGIPGILKPGLNEVTVGLVLTKEKNDIVINFKKSKDVKATLWLNDSENKIFEETTTAGNKVITPEFKKFLYEQSVVTALRQVFNALVGNETEWNILKNTVQGQLTMPQLYTLIEDYLKTHHPDYWKRRVYVALTQYKNNLRVACFTKSKKNDKWYNDESFNTKFISSTPFEVPYYEEEKADEIEIGSETGVEAPTVVPPVPDDW